MSILFLSVFVPAEAQSTSVQLHDAQSRADQLKSQYQRIAEAYLQNQNALERTRGHMEQTQAAISRSESDMAKLTGRLKTRVRAAYEMGGSIGLFNLLLQAENFKDFTVRFVVLQQQSLADQQLILQIRRKRAELDSRRSELTSEEKTFAGQGSDLRDRAHSLSISFDQAQTLVRQLNGRLRLEQIAALFRTYHGGSSGGVTVPLDACPVAGPHYVNNDWGAPRGGGTRRHQGNDIMAPKGTPLVAVVSGVIAAKQTGGLGGNAYFLSGNGNSFYYAHLNDFVAGEGQHVSAGQLIGHVGNTGDAVGGPDHLHFEIHPGGGGAVDPHPSLMRVC